MNVAASRVGSVRPLRVLRALLAVAVVGPGLLLESSVVSAGEGFRVPQPLPLKWIADVRLPGNANRMDYVDVDARKHRLYIAHLGDSAVIAFDLKHQQVVDVVEGIAAVHGVLAIPALQRVYASATRDDAVKSIDENTLEVTATIPAGDFPDGMVWVPWAHELFVSDEFGMTETVIDTRTNRREKTIPLWSTVGNSQYDPVSRHVLVAAQSQDQLLAIDPRSDHVVARYPLTGGDAPHGLYIDAPDRLAFIGCEGNDRLLVFDLKQHRVIDSFPVGQTPDVLDFDARRGRLYVATEQGEVSVFRVSHRRVTPLGSGMLGDNAHTLAVDPDTGRVYLPLKDVDGHPALRILAPVGTRTGMAGAGHT